MKIVSVNVGLPREVAWKGITVQTAIFKEPVAATVAIRELNLAGDQQADLAVHGGSEKAVYAYPAEHYEYWRKQLSDISFSWGAFGENLTTAGLWEDTLSCDTACIRSFQRAQNLSPPSRFNTCNRCALAFDLHHSSM